MEECNWEEFEHYILSKDFHNWYRLPQCVNVLIQRCYVSCTKMHCVKHVFNWYRLPQCVKLKEEKRRNNQEYETLCSIEIRNCFISMNFLTLALCFEQNWALCILLLHILVYFRCGICRETADALCGRVSSQTPWENQKTGAGCIYFGCWTCKIRERWKKEEIGFSSLYYPWSWDYALKLLPMESERKRIEKFI